MTRQPSAQTPRFSARRRRRFSGDSGSVLIELVIIAPVLLILSLGALEVGVAWRDSVNVIQAGRQGARVGSHLGDELVADQEILAAVESVVGAQSGTIESVVVYRADTAGDMAAGCLTASQAGECNRYTATEIADLADPSHWGCGAGSHDATWCPSARTDADEYLGVHIVFDRPSVSGIFGNGAPTVTTHTVMRIEPEYTI